MGNDGYKRQLAVSSGIAAQLGGCYCKSLNPVGRMRLSFNLIQKRSRIKRKWIVNIQVLKWKILQIINGSHIAAG